MKKKHAKHFDSGKPELDQIPYSAIVECSKAFTFGKNKYGKFNFRRGMPYSKLINSALRHIYKFNESEDFDDESITVTHIGHAMANLAMLVYVYQNMPELDDRWKPDGYRRNTTKRRSSKKSSRKR